MARKLLSDYLTNTIHIALLILFSCFGVQVEAQSVLLPGDIVVVSVNASDNTVDIVPLIDIKEGTILNVSAGKWDATEKVLTGTEASIRFLTSVQSGTNLRLNGRDSDLFEFNGRFSFKNSGNNFYVYQKDENIYRFIYGLKWGAEPAKTGSNASNGDDWVPAVLKEHSNTFLELDDKQNHQYYIRNGASGTQNMLLSFVGNIDNWNSSTSPFPSIETSFKLLTPPVVMFDSISSEFTEGDTAAVLKIAIYEHDGSRVSVDVEFDSTSSIAGREDFNGFKTQTLNFTGLVGTYVMEVGLPIIRDDKFEGKEGGIFHLKNLTGGSLGDFISHNVVIDDDDTPRLVITNVSNGTDESSYIEISNLEDKEVSLRGWSIISDNSEVKIDSSVVLGAYKKVRLLDDNYKLRNDEQTVAIIVNELKEQVLGDDGGLLTLKNYNDKTIHQVGYSRSRVPQNNNIALSRMNETTSGENIGNTAVAPEASSSILNTDGWAMVQLGSEVNNASYAGKIFYTWDNENKEFIELSHDELNRIEKPVLGFFKEDELETLNKSLEQKKAKNGSTESISAIISSSDQNNSGVIEGIEGLNLLYNPFKISLNARELEDRLREELGGVSALELFSIGKNSNGTLYFKNVMKEDVIPAGSYFWVRIKTAMEPTSVTLSGNSFDTALEQPEMKDAGEPSEDMGVIELGLTAGSHKRTIKLYVGEGNTDLNATDLNSYYRLFPEEHGLFVFSIKQGNEYYNTLSIPRSTEQAVSFDLNFGSIIYDAYTLTVNDIDNLPAGWSAKLVDTYNDKEYDLRSDFSVNFDHTVEKYEGFNSERFEVRVIPKGAQQSSKAALADLPREIELNQNYPNPFNPVTTISFYLPESEDVKLSIFNIVGQPVAVLFDGRLSSGQQQFDWDATDKPSGMYIYQLEVGNKVMTRKMTLVK